MTQTYDGPVDAVTEEWEELPDGGRGKKTMHYYQGQLVRQDYHLILPPMYMRAVANLGGQ